MILFNPYLLLFTTTLILMSCQPSVEEFKQLDWLSIPFDLRKENSTGTKITMEPMGTFYLPTPPQKVGVYQGIEFEMLLALGKGDRVISAFERKNLETTFKNYHSQIPGMEINFDQIKNIPSGRQAEPELFFSLDCDLFLIDPRLALISWGWSIDEFFQVTKRIAPFTGNFIRYRRGELWGPTYKEYTLEESFRIHSKIFNEEKKAEAILKFHDTVEEKVDSLIQSVDSIPTVLVINTGSDPSKGNFYIQDINRGGTEMAHYRALKIKQPFSSQEQSFKEYGKSGYEILAQLDPDIIIVHWASILNETEQNFIDQYITPFKNHSIGKNLRAVKNNKVFAGGSGEQGVLTYLFQLEMAGQQIYPQVFGEWNWQSKSNPKLWSRDSLSKIIFN